jgi:hypothetical protein
LLETGLGNVPIKKGLLVLVASTIIVGYGNYLGSSSTGH